MDNLDLVNVYTPEGELKKVEREQLSEALSVGFKLAEDVPTQKPKESLLGSGLAATAKGIKSVTPSALQTLAETGEDVVRLGAQGASFGFSDEALAALRAGKESLTSEKSLADLYEEYKKIEEEKLQKSRERSPVLGTVAEFGGAILPGIAATAFTGGAAAPAVAPSLGRALGKAAVTGAIGGAFTAAGTSESPVLSDIEFDPSKGIVYGEKAEQFAKDVLGGAASGAIVAPMFEGGIRALGKVAGGIKKSIKGLGDKYDEAENNLVAFKETKERGTDFTTKQGKEALDIRKENYATEVQQKLMQVENAIGNEIKQSIDDATSRGIKFETNNFVSEMDDSLSVLNKKPQKNKKLMEAIQVTKNTSDLDPRTLWDLRDEIKKIMAKTDDSEEYEVLQNLSDKIRENLNQINEFKLANTAFESFRTNAGETILHRGKPKTITLTDKATGKTTDKRIANYASDKDSQRDYYQNLQIRIFDDLAKIGRQGGSGDEARRTIRELNNSLKKFEKETGRNLKEQYGLDPDELKDTFKYEGIVQGIKQRIHGYDKGYGEAAISPTDIAKQVPAILKRPFTLARTAGSVARAKPLEKLSQTVYKLPEAAMDKLADSIASKYPNYSRSLKQAIANKDTYKKNAAIFGLMQQPGFRDMAPVLLEELSTEEGEPSNE